MSGMARTLLFTAVLLAGCFDAHSMTGDGGHLAPDAGAPPVRCAPSPLSETHGEPCFCNGPLAAAGSVVYRRAIGIEVYDVSRPDAPVLVREVEERPSSQGALLADVARSALYSVSDFAGLHVYDIAAPLAPRLIDQVELAGSISSGALDGTTLVVTAADEERGLLYVLDVSRPSAVRLERTIPLERWPTAVALEGRTAAIVFGDGPHESWLLLVDTASGATLASAQLPGSSFGRAVALRGEHVFVTGGDRALTVLRRSDSTLSVAGALGDESSYARSLRLDGARLITGGDRLRVVDVSDPTSPRLLGESPGPLGDVGAVEARGELAYVSNGNGLAIVALGCE